MDNWCKSIKEYRAIEILQMMINKGIKLNAEELELYKKFNPNYKQKTSDEIKDINLSKRCELLAKKHNVWECKNANRYCPMCGRELSEV